MGGLLHTRTLDTLVATELEIPQGRQVAKILAIAKLVRRSRMIPLFLVSYQAESVSTLLSNPDSRNISVPTWEK